MASLSPLAISLSCAILDDEICFVICHLPYSDRPPGILHEKWKPGTFFSDCMKGKEKTTLDLNFFGLDETFWAQC